jgi:hypothetical protein
MFPSPSHHVTVTGCHALGFILHLDFFVRKKVVFSKRHFPVITGLERRVDKGRVERVQEMGEMVKLYWGYGMEHSSI